MYEKMSIAIIGCGGIAEAHCQTVLGKDPNIKLYMYDVDFGRAEALCKKYSGAGCFNTYQEVLSSKDIDVVDICVPHDEHVPVIISAAKAGKHILSEKPIARTLAEADQILDAVKKSGVRFFVAECYRFYPSALKAKELIDEGVIGEPFLIQINSMHFHIPPGWRRSKEKNGGGVLIDRGIHFVNYLRLLGGKVKTIFATFNHSAVKEMEGEDTATVPVKFENDATGQMVISWGTRMFTPFAWLAVYGSEGTMYDIGDGFYVFSIKDERFNDNGKPVRLFDTMLEPYIIPAEMQHFVDRMRDGNEFAVTGESARADLEIVELATRSAETGQAIHLL
ncbi:MAG: Gfo/Idh/MocA family protein [Candidatus Poribacteria bacterium]